MALALIAATPRRRRLARRIPSRAVRRANSAREPRAAALAYIRLTRQKSEIFNRAIEELIFPALEDLAVPEPDKPRFAVTSERTDAPTLPIEYIRQRLGLLELRLGAIFDDEALGEDLDVIGRRVSAKNMTELKRVVGISIQSADRGVGVLVDGFRATNVDKITSLVGKQLVEITQILEQSTITGLRVEQLRDQIQARFKVTKSKAALLARDQTLTLNAQIARQRQTNLGIEEYIWTTSGDGKVRETHADLDGTKHRWDTPPVISDDDRTGHPGEDHQCRCTAFPVLPELA